MSDLITRMRRVLNTALAGNDDGRVPVTISASELYALIHFAEQALKEKAAS